MKTRWLLAVVALSISVVAGRGIRAQDCAPDGKVQFICGIGVPEDLIAVPHSDWVIASEHMGGGLYLISTRDYTSTRMFPSTALRVRHDTRTYAACPGPLDPSVSTKMSALGLNIRPGQSGVHTVYVVHGGDRESVEVFELDTRPKVPVMTWIGCAVVPGAQGLDAVSPLPNGGFVATSIVSRTSKTVVADLLNGTNTGEVWEWQPKDGWKIVPGSESPGPNGIEASKDGRWLYVNLWSVGKLMRLSRGQSPVQKQLVDLPFHPDNIRWQTDGSLVAAGHSASTLQHQMECQGGKVCPDTSSNAARIDPQSLRVQEILRYPANEFFSNATTALQVGKEIWLGAFVGRRIARYPIQE